MRVALIVILVTVLMVPSIARCAPMGSPANNAGKENYAVTLEYEQQNKNVGDDKSSSWRWLTRIAWGVSEEFDLYARVGAANLKVDRQGGGTFNGDPSAAYGLGGRFTTSLSEEHNVLFFADFQYLGFTSKGKMSLEKYDDFSGSYTEVWSDKYWWGEYQFSALLVWQRSVWVPYAGLGLTRVDGKVDKNLYIDTDGRPYFAGSETSEFSESVIPEFVFGMDFPLKGTAKFSWELRYGGDDVSYFMGLSELWQ
jgi:hypothetical protein